MDNKGTTEREMPILDNGTPEKEFPKYKCHKVVWALQIESIKQNLTTITADLSYDLSFVEDGYALIRVTFGFFDKHKPKAGDYYVVYKDGYKSISPAKAFEAGYTKVD